MGCCCISLRSAVFWGTSILLVIGLRDFSVFLMKIVLYFVFAKRPVETSLTLIRFFILLFGVLLFPLAAIIFRGVEKERVRLIRTPMWILFAVKLSELSLRYYEEGALFHPNRRVPWEDRLYEGIEIGGFLIYLLMLFLYTRGLLEGTEGSDYCKASEVDDVSIQKRKSKLMEC